MELIEGFRFAWAAIDPLDEVIDELTQRGPVGEEPRQTANGCRRLLTPRLASGTGACRR